MYLDFKLGPAWGMVLGLPVVKWYDFISEPTLADVIMDRLAGNAHRIELKGESLRKKRQKKKNNFIQQIHHQNGWLTLGRNGGSICPE